MNRTWRILLPALLCIGLAAVGFLYWKPSATHEPVDDERQILSYVEFPTVSSEEYLLVALYDKEGNLLLEQRAISTEQGMLLRLNGLLEREMASAKAQRYERKSDAPLGELLPVSLRPYEGISPDEVYKPGKKSKECLFYQEQELPIYQNAKQSQLAQGDFAWSQEHPDRLEYLGERYSAEFGIDVSAHQNKANKTGKIDWKAAAEDGVSFAMIRAGFRGTTSGKLYEDAYFRDNLKGAMEAGLDTGVYVFSQAVTVEEALEEADFVLELLQNTDFSGPVAFDWEIHEPGYRAYGTSGEMATACAVAFCRKMEEAGYPAMVYSSQAVNYLLYDQEALSPFLRWYPEYKSTSSERLSPDLFYEIALWQFSSSCRVAGISGAVDGNLRFSPR